MPNYFLINPNGKKQGPISEERLQELAVSGFIDPNTPLETDAGHKGIAGQIPGLKFHSAKPSPSTITPPPVDYQTAQVIERPHVQRTTESNSLLSRFTYIFLAVSVGMFGVHDFYVKRIGPGAIHLACLGPWILVVLIMTITSFLGGLGIKVEINWFKPPTSLDGVQQMTGWLYFFFVSLPIVSYVMALIEIILVTEDGLGREFERF